MTYANLRPRLTKPRSILDRTAVAMLDLLRANPGILVLASDMRDYIKAHGGDPEARSFAAKALRNVGHEVVAIKRGRYSAYLLDATADQVEADRGRMFRELYSSVVTFCRKMELSATPTDVQRTLTLRQATLLAIALGTDPTMAKTIPDVMNELQALPTR